MIIIYTQDNSPWLLIMLNLDAIKEALSLRLGISLSQLEQEVERIGEELGIDVLASIVEFISRKNYAFKVSDLLEIIRIGSGLKRIKDLKAGLRGINIIGRVESIKRYDSPSKLTAIILIFDGTGYAQVYVYGDDELEILEKLVLGDIVVLENVLVSEIFRSGIPKILLTKNSSIKILAEDTIEKYFFVVPKMEIYDINDLLSNKEDFLSMTQSAYYHVRGIYLGIVGDETKGKFRERVVTIALGDINSFAQKKIYLLLRRGAIREFETLRIVPGMILYAHGVLIKKVSDKIFILARNLSSFEIKRLPYIKPALLEAGSYWGYIITPKSKVDVKEYSRGVYARFLAVTDEGDFIRVFVWHSGLARSLEDRELGEKLWIFGQIRRRGGVTEIHISEIYGAVVEITKEFLEVPQESLEYLKIGMKKQVSIRTNGLIIGFEDLIHHLGGVIDVIAKIQDIRDIRSGKLIGIATISDGSKEVKVLIWDEEKLILLENNVNALAKITRLRVSRDKRNPENILLMMTSKTQVELLAKNFNYWLDEVNTDIYNQLLDEDKLALGEEIKIWGTIVKIEKIDQLYLCGVCGNLIVDYEKQVCELGHVGNVIMKEALFIVIDNGFFELRVILPMEFLNVDNKDLYYLIEKFVGIDICVWGKLKIDLSSGEPQRIFLVSRIC